MLIEEIKGASSSLTLNGASRARCWSLRAQIAREFEELLIF